MRSPSTSLILALLAALTACGDSTPPFPGSPPAPVPLARCGDLAQRPWCNKALSAEERTRLLLGQMTLRQKIGLMAGDDSAAAAQGGEATGISNGIAELGIPTLYMSDGPVGPREGHATAMPAPLALGASFDPELARRTGAAIAEEVRDKGNDLVHAPTVDVMRNPLAGRVFEAYGEDPLLSSRLGVAWIQGAQDSGVIANVKHFAMNTQEGQVGLPPLVSVVGSRFFVDAIVDERTLREIYLPPFEAAVQAGVGSVMCAYNRVNGSPACSSEYLLERVLRGDWGFDGFVVTDYIAAMKDTVNSANNGTEIEMPLGVFYAPLQLELAVIGGRIPTTTIDKRVRNILRTLFRFGFFDRADYASDDALIDRAGHARVARDTAEQGMVLLRNEGLLPLDASAVHSIAVIGSASRRMVNGGGSSMVIPFEFKSALQAISGRAGPGIAVVYDDGSNAGRAAEVAAAADVVLLFAADGATEGTDKRCLSLDCAAPDPIGVALCWGEYGPLSSLCPTLLPAVGQDALIAAVAAANPKTAVILNVGGPVLTPWREQVAAVLVTWYAGQEGGTALARVLFGDTDPGGRLPVSFPKAETDTPLAGNPLRYPGVLERAQYSEGLFIGYRWHDQQSVEPAYAFGQGLSYTRFDYDDLAITYRGAGSMRLSLRVRNQGSRAGWATPQLYLSLPSTIAVPQPPKALKGFAKRWLTPGQEIRVEIDLDPRAFSFWDAEAADWRFAAGCHVLLAGASSRELPLRGSFTLDANGVARDVAACPEAG